MTRTGKVAALRREAADTVVFVSTDDAERAGLAEGEPALVSSPRGEVRARVHVDSAQQPGLLFLPFHRGPLLQPSGWTNTLLGRTLDPISFQPELKHTIARLEPAPKRVALSGGELARAVELRLGGEGVTAMFVTAAELASVPSGVMRVLIPGDLEQGVVPWWDLAGQPELVPPAPEGGFALIDLRQGPEALAALPALAAAGWTVRRLGDGGLPLQVLGLLDKKLPAAGSEVLTLVVGASRAAAGAPSDEQILVLQPGGSLGGEHPLSGDPTTLAAFLAGRIPARAALRRLVVPLGRLALVLVGEPVGAGEADLLIHEDRVSGQAQIWRLSSGEVLGAAAVVERPVAEDVERLWLADVEPGVVRSRVPLH
jgi:formylmethanofuran dehydrogenase subunit D